jgi:hypothetical protein
MTALLNRYFRNFLALCALLFSLNLSAQKLDPGQVKAMVESGRFTFKAQTALPQSGASLPLTSEYDLRVSPDSVVSFLPYYGRAYSPVYPGEGGIKFTSTEFAYAYKWKKKKGWDVTLTPKDTRDARQLILRISENGYASLQVISNNRQAISFNGYVK